uniref:ZP domain-containing protein n=1 Tax=Parascaris equorum TaxID=6256 RepID=A0A914RJN7_PAREQ
MAKINVNTKNPFVGHVYVKGLYSKTECRHEGTGEPVGGIQLPFDSCNVARMRSLSPRGVFVRTTITVSAQLEVSDLTTVFQTQALPMPICRYDVSYFFVLQVSLNFLSPLPIPRFSLSKQIILEGGPTGQPVQFGIIGQQVYHKWTCDSETTDTFCAVITITIKEPGSECPKPTCSEPEGFGALKSGQIEEIKFDRARLIRKRAIDDENTLDVRTEINTLEIIDQVHSSIKCLASIIVPSFYSVAYEC